MHWYLAVWRNYLGFTGRAQRSEYWYFQLFNLIIFIVLAVIDASFGTLHPEVGMGLLSGLYWLAVLLPSIAVTVRRLHDTGRSGWWLLLVFVPLIGGIIVLVFMLLDSQPGQNQHGPNPKGVMAATV